MNLFVYLEDYLIAHAHSARTGLKVDCVWLIVFGRFGHMNMTKMGLKMAKMGLMMGKMRPKMTKMRPKMGKMRPKMGKMRSIEKKPKNTHENVYPCMHGSPSKRGPRWQR